MLIFRRSKLYFTASGMSLSVSGRAVHKLRADCSKHVELYNVIHILQNKAICIKLVIKTSLYYDARSEKHKKD
jgi:hypothetical protein